MNILIAMLALQQENPAPVPGWLQETAAGFAEAKSTGKPMLVVFR
jgi:hypothetical protein